MADTEAAASAKADAILEKARALQGVTGFPRKAEPINEGSRRLLEAAAKGSRHEQPLWTNVKRLREAGLPGLVTARRFGGHEAGLALAVGVVGAISRGEPSTGLILAQQYLFHGALRSNPLWPDALRERVSVSAVRDGGLVTSFRVEAELGTPIRGGLPATTARRVPGGWAISGHEIFSTGAPGLAWSAIWAKTDEDAPRVGIFIVPRGTPWLEIIETCDHLGMRATCSHDAILTNVFVPEDHAVDIRAPAALLERDPVLPA